MLATIVSSVTASVVSEAASLVATSVESGVESEDESESLPHALEQRRDGDGGHDRAGASRRTASCRGTHGDRSIPASPITTRLNPRLCRESCGPPPQFSRHKPSRRRHGLWGSLRWARLPKGAATIVILSFPARLRALATERPDAPAVTCAGTTLTRAELESRANRLARELQSYGVGVGDFVTIAVPNSVDWFVAYLATWKLGAVPQPVSAKLPGRELGGDRRTRRIEGGDRRSGRSLRTPVRLDHPPPPRPRAAARVLRRATPGRRVAGVEGTDVGWVDRSPEADRVGRPGRVRHRGPGPARRPRRRMHARARAAVPQRPRGLGVPGVAARQPRRAAAAVRRRAGARLDRALRRRRRLPRADDDEADPAPRRRRPPRLRPVVAADRVAPRRAVPAVAEGGMDRLARPGADLRAVCRHRGAGGHDHQRRRVAGAPRVRSAA